MRPGLSLDRWVDVVARLAAVAIWSILGLFVLSLVFVI